MADFATMIDSHNYVEANLPPSIVEKLEAGAFRSLCEHLKERSDEVQNLDLMTVSGFCRNCLAKWMVIEARKLSKDQTGQNLEALDALGYDEAAQYVYGCDYDAWKQRHAKKATDEQMARYNDSKPIHSVFDKNLLAKRIEKLASPTSDAIATGSSASDGKKALLSNVCCQDVDEQNRESQPPAPPSEVVKSNPKARTLPPFLPPQAPSGGIAFSVAILTVSDRAFKNEYETGDQSGPAVQRAVQLCTNTLSTSETPVSCTMQEIVIIPDDIEAIQTKLRECADAGVDLILTTGGTGFSARDVTPEATVAVVDRECHGLMAFVTTECSKIQSLASLSRGTAGVLGKTMICNLPGNPKGVEEIVPILLPIVIHGIYEMQVEK